MSENTTATATARRRGTSSVLRATGSSLLTAILALVSLIIVWMAAIWLLRVPPFVGKGPVDVWRYLFEGEEAEANRVYVFGELGQTLLDASIGFSAGMGAALLLAALFVLVRPIEHAIMPLALLVQSMPLIAIAPLIILIFGRETSTVAVMGGLVVVFPALVTIVFGLRSVSPYMVELVSVYGGGPLATLLRVALPASVPALFSAVRIAVPGSITGALIAEWLATGQGAGRAIVAAVAQAKMSEVWSLAAVVTVVSISLYMAVNLIESAVLTRFGFRRAEA